MAYDKHIWTCGEAITTEKLNHMEDGIAEGGEVSLEDLEALLPTETASGEIVTITDGQSIVPVKSLKVALEPIQDLNGYDKPWVGGAGKNLLNVGSRVNQTSANVTYTSNDNYIIANGTKNGGGYADLSTLTVTLNSGTYYARAFVISGTGSADVAGLYVYDGSSNLTSSSIIGTERQFTLSEAKTVRFRFGIFTDGVVFTNWTIGIVLSKTSGITSWTPYSNICPISGRTEVVTHRTGKNLLNPYTFVGGVIDTTGSLSTSNVVNFSVDDGVITYTSTQAWRGVTSEYIEVDDSKSHVLSINGTPTGVMWSWYDRNKAFISQQHESLANLRAKTPPTGAKYLRITPEQSAQGTYSYSDVQLELGSTATSYEPYQGNTYTTSLGQTVYGGTLDVVSGVLTVDRAMVTLDGSQNMQANGMTANTSRFFYTASPTKASGVDNFIADRFAYASTDTVGAAVGRSRNGGIEFRLPTSVPQTVDGYKTWFTDNPTTLVYELATPQTYQLTPQQIELFLGTNNVWSDGEATMIYNADVQLWVEKKLS